MPDGALSPSHNLLKSWIFTHNSLNRVENYAEKQKIYSEWQFCGQKHLVNQRGEEENGQTGSN